MTDLFQYCIFFLGLNSPVRFEYREKIWKGNTGVHWALIYDTGEVKEHIIKASSLHMVSNDNRSFESVLAHEFVHAWQAEYKRWKKKSHNKDFQNMAKKLQEFLTEEGFDIQDIYLPEVDTK